MSVQSIESSPSWITHLGDARWVRAHISTFCLGAVILVGANLLFGGDDFWSLTAIGIWIMLLIVHIVVVIIARLSLQLMADDEEEVVLLPIKDAVIIEPAAAPPSWETLTTPEPWREEPKSPVADETVSWSVATDVAQVKRNPKEGIAE